MKKLYSLKMFVESIKIPATLTCVSTGAIITSNEHARRLFLGNNASLNSLLESGIDNPLIAANLQFCKYIQDRCILDNSQAISHECFDGDYYCVFRTIVDDNDESLLLTLISNSADAQKENWVHF